LENGCGIFGTGRGEQRWQDAAGQRSRVKLDRRREMIARAYRSVGEDGGQRLLQRGCRFGPGRHKGGGVRAAQWLDGTGRGRRAA
jgi:hypothetical protein